MLTPSGFSGGHGYLQGLRAKEAYAQYSLSILLRSDQHLHVWDLCCLQSDLKAITRARQVRRRKRATTQLVCGGSCHVFGGAAPSAALRWGRFTFSQIYPPVLDCFHCTSCLGRWREVSEQTLLDIPPPDQCWGEIKDLVDLTALLCFYVATVWCRDTVCCRARWCFCTPKEMSASTQNSAFPHLFSRGKGWLAFTEFNVEILSSLVKLSCLMYNVSN